jgi:hypothetical protein
MEGKRKEKKRERMKKTKRRNSLFFSRVASLLKGKQKNSLSCATAMVQFQSFF